MVSEEGGRNLNLHPGFPAPHMMKSLDDLALL